MKIEEGMITRRKEIANGAKDSGHPPDGERPEWGLSGEEKENDPNRRRKGRRSPTTSRNLDRNQRRGNGKHSRVRPNIRQRDDIWPHATKRHRRDSGRRGRGLGPPRGREKVDSSHADSEELSPSDSESSEETTDPDRTATMADQLPMALRREIEGRRRFEAYSERTHLLTTRLSALSGYYAFDSIRTMREQGRGYFLADIRKGMTNRRP